MKSLKNRLLFNLNYFGNWVLYFIIARFVFLFFYFDKTSELDWKTIVLIPIYGFKLDLAFASYLAAIPFLISAFSLWIPKNIFKKTILIFTYPFLFFITLLLLFDLALYGPWGVRLDATPLVYLNTPKEMLASVPTVQLILTTIAWILISLGACFIFRKKIRLNTQNFEKGSLWNFPILILCTGFLIVPMRGGFQNTPINHSAVYFSDQMFANHAAINFAWNFSNALNSNTYKMENPFVKMDLDTAKNIISDSKKDLLLKPNDSIQKSILKSKKPNVILIIWESLTAKLVQPLGGEPNVTENFNRLSEEGLLFTNFYANGDRSDKGLIAILSGYYPQPHKSIIKSPSKTRNLPSLNKELKKIGYQTSFYHGGDLNFGNMKTYLRGSGVNHFVDESDFDTKDHNSKWGAHDHILFKRFLKDINNDKKQPFFKTLFTLSSHEPFEFPDAYKFGKDGNENKFRSSMAYTDKTIGNFIKEAKKQPWWDNTLIVIMADHGHPLPKHRGIFNGPKKFHIPMLWLGGALQKTNSKIENISSQTDFPYTLLSLLDGDTKDFTWSKHIFANSENHFAQYIFNKGFGVISKSDTVVYDYPSNKIIFKKGENTSRQEKIGKAITQNAYQDFLERK